MDLFKVLKIFYIITIHDRVSHIQTFWYNTIQSLVEYSGTRKRQSRTIAFKIT